jgi:hypothetical protein
VVRILEDWWPTRTDCDDIDHVLHGVGQLVEVLPAGEYYAEYLPSTVSILLKTLCWSAPASNGDCAVRKGRHHISFQRGCWASR